MSDGRICSRTVSPSSAPLVSALYTSTRRRMAKQAGEQRLTGTKRVVSVMASIPPDKGKKLCGKESCRHGQKRSEPYRRQNIERLGTAECAADTRDGRGQQLDRGGVEHDQKAQLVGGNAHTAVSHSACGTDPQRR